MLWVGDEHLSRDKVRDLVSDLNDTQETALSDGLEEVEIYFLLSPIPLNDLAEIICHLERWVDTGSLELAPFQKASEEVAN